ncbi:RDD family protein [Rhodobium gokarnense]|uniref:RDD family membrane protein YckC n=1 Tax=Rhodobium gokarnense TaxID=364296 RepID=A0ABT3HG85_9HYPH|nr:RDD family protein [Rhodobium gokarnense]MCW2309415.1 putative RDD family membrane protein YckC [Rhodobium gokarnense]
MIRRSRPSEKRPPVDEIMPPEGVPLKLKVAGVGVRLAAQIADVLITFVGALAIFLLLIALGATDPTSTLAIGVMLFFLIRVPYYVVSELVWNGQTLGKRLMKIKVVAHDGGPLTTHAVVARNLMKEAEVLLPATLLLALDADEPVLMLLGLAWIVITLLVPLLNRYRMRLGDMIAGTHVIHLPVPILLKDLAAEAPRGAATGDRFTFLPHQLDHYGAFELQTLEKFLRVEERSVALSEYTNHRATLAAIVDRIQHKIGHADPIPPSDHREFLRAFYNAQREHLEQRQLFGDRRKDKHFAASSEDE